MKYKTAQQIASTAGEKGVIGGLPADHAHKATTLPAGWKIVTKGGVDRLVPCEGHTTAAAAKSLATALRAEVEANPATAAVSNTTATRIARAALQRGSTWAAAKAAMAIRAAIAESPQLGGGLKTRFFVGGIKGLQRLCRCWSLPRPAGKISSAEAEEIFWLVKQTL